jgi:beta-glucanase (GH16 family)
MTHRGSAAKRGHYQLRWWVLAIGVAVALAIAIRPISLLVSHGSVRGHSSTKGAAASSHSSAPTASPWPSVDVPVVSAIPGILRPHSNPEFMATFSGSQLNTSVWSTCYPGFDQSGCTNFGNPNAELEWYVPTQVQVAGGLLHLVAQQIPTTGRTASGGPQTYACRSGMVTTYPSFQFEYGYIQVVAKIPSGAGLWPALWLAAANNKWPPEMDMVEVNSGPAPYAGMFFHYSTSTGNGVQEIHTSSAQVSGWHTFALSWTSSQMTWLLDGHVMMIVRQDVPHQEMYFIANLAEAITSSNRDVTAGECNGSLDISSVKVWGP